MNLPRVMVGGPVRDREWAVPLWLGGLLGLDYPPELLSLCVLVNDSVDGTLECCRWWADRAVSELWRDGQVQDVRYGCAVNNNLRQTRDFRQFALARDAWAMMRRDEEWLFSVDSDILVPSTLLRDLIERAERSGVKMLAAVIDNSHGGGMYDHTNVMDPDESGRWWHTPGAYADRDDEIRPCGLTGACVLLHRSIFDAGVRYTRPYDDSVLVGEDAAFCSQLAAIGVTPHYCPALRAWHCMTGPEDQSYLRDPLWHLRLAEYHDERALRCEERAHATATG